MKKRTLTAALATAALAFSGAAAADGPDWTFVQAFYGIAQSGSDDSNNLWGAGGSIGFAEMFHASGQYGTGDLDDLGSDRDAWDIRVGVHQGITDSTDIFVDLLYGNVDIDDGSDGDYYGGVFGVRSMITDTVEINGGVIAAQVDDEAFGCTGGGCDDSTEVNGTLGGRYGFSDALSFGVTWIENDLREDGGDSITFDLRWAFAGL